MKSTLKHSKFFSETSDTANFKFLPFVSSMRLWASVFSVFLLNLLRAENSIYKMPSEKVKNKVLEFFSDNPVGQDFPASMTLYRTKNPVSYITAFLIIGTSVFSSIRKQCADGCLEKDFFSSSLLRLIFFTVNPKWEGFL